jgi:hypothetical protein
MIVWIGLYWLRIRISGELVFEHGNKFGKVDYKGQEIS